MVIQGNNKSIEFKINGYQFPEYKGISGEYDYDANWLICEIKYSEDEIEEIYSDACLLTFEFTEIVNALSKAIDGDGNGYISEFMEPYLKIAMAKAEDKVMFIFHYIYDTSDGIWKSRKCSAAVERDCAIQILEELKEIQKSYPMR